ncbi:lytic murein transglycosylase [Pseudomonas aeruginosa]|nr:lytic murein transglycosylase [Pseudomonas aeruginosa]
MPWTSTATASVTSGARPADALASTANYLKASGWIAGQPWGFEVRLPAGFDYSLGGTHHPQALGEWQGMGVQGVNGGPLPSGLSGEQASLLLPAGHRGPPSWCCTTSAPSSSTTTPAPTPWPSACSPTASRAAAG